MMTAMMRPMGAGAMMPGMGTAPAPNQAINCLMVPRCTMKVEKCQGGMKITCSCDDTMACNTLQNLCNGMPGAMCSCCCIVNGMTVCCCNLTMGTCKCENTKDGVCVTCTSGDKECCNMIQACCESIAAMMKAGCTCCVMMNNMPVCCC